MARFRPTPRVSQRSWAVRGVAMLILVSAGSIALVAVSESAHAHSPAGDARIGPSSTTTTAPAGTGTLSTTTTVVAPPTTSSTVVASTTTSVPPAVTPPYATTTRDVTLVDSSRSTPARDGETGSPVRTLRTVVVTPVIPNAVLPVIVFAHGYDSEPETYMPLLQSWASAGYLVLAPESPGSAADLPGTPIRTDIGGQAQDLSFVITTALNGTFGAVNPARITVAGHSDGGSAVATLALNGAYYDSRIANYLVLSGAIPDGVDGTWGTTPESGRLLVVVGDQDEYGNLPASTAVYTTATMAKTLVVAPGGDHLDTYIADTPLADQVRAEIVAFLAGGTASGSLELTTSPALS
jgi:pimeloyl-ACP methyl ester carboxylesterase